GAHTIEVETSGNTVESKKLTLAEKETKSVEFEIHDKPAPPAASSSSAPAEQPPQVNRLPVWIAGGVGVAGLVAAGAFTIGRGIDVQRVADTCRTTNPYTGCNPDFQNIASEAQAFSTASGVSLGVGIAGLATAGVLYLVIKPTKQSAKKTSSWTLVPGR